jgi:hypothetical protein
MKQQLLLKKKLSIKPHKREKAQTRFMNVSGTEKIGNFETNLKLNSLELKDFVKLFDCPDNVFKGWGF